MELEITLDLGFAPRMVVSSGTSFEDASYWYRDSRLTLVGGVSSPYTSSSELVCLESSLKSLLSLLLSVITTIFSYLINIFAESQRIALFVNNLLDVIFALTSTTIRLDIVSKHN